MTEEKQAAILGRDDTFANYVSRIPPESFSRLTRREDPERKEVRTGLYALWAAMAVGMVVMVHANDFF